MTHTQVASPTTEETGKRLAIADVLNRHCRGLDRNDAELLKSCYWPDAGVDYGNFKGPAHDFADLIGPALSQAYELTRHCIGNTLLQFEGDTAYAESYVQAGHLLIGGETEMRFEGRYLDRLEQREGAWAIAHRQVVMDWSRTTGLQDERDSEAFAALAKGKADNSDPLYPFLARSSTP